MTTTMITIKQDDEMGKDLLVAASEMARYRDLRDAADGEVSGWRDVLIRYIPALREYLPPDAKSVNVVSSDGLVQYRLTIQRTGGQERISKTKLLELGVSPDTISAATERTAVGETVTVVRSKL